MRFILFTALLVLSESLQASTPTTPVCDIVKKNKEPSLFLIDKTGNLSRGPIDFGTYFYIYKPRDFVLIPTEHRLIVAPSRIKVSGSGEGVIGITGVLKPTTSICPNSKTYNIFYSMSEARSRADIPKLPYIETSGLGFPRMDDPNIETGDFDIKYNFDSRITGKIVDGTIKNQ